MIDCSPCLAYLQRARGALQSLPAFPEPQADGFSRVVLRVRAVGREPIVPPAQTPKSRERLSAESFLSSLATFNVPLCFRVESVGETLHFEFGTWHKSRDKQLQEQMLEASIRTIYPAVRFEPVAPRQPVQYTRGGYVIGIPTFSRTASAPLDDVIRSVGSGNWSITVVAEPLDADFTQQLRGELLAELSRVSADLHHERAPNEIASTYVELLKLMLADYNLGVAQGAWRAGIYLCGDQRTYFLLASAWRGIFSGDRSVPQPVRITQEPLAVAAAQKWSLPDAEAPPDRPPNHFRHWLAFQTILPTHCLAPYCQLPEREVPGLRVFPMLKFDFEPASPPHGPILGRVIRHPEEFDERAPERSAGAAFRVDPDELTGHTLVVGATGSGKTTTLFSLLRNVATTGRKFLVIEPAKMEYRRLLTTEWGQKQNLTVLTLGAETIAPFRINPFEPASLATPVSTHIDLLRTTFAASFGMWSPLPQILERCIYEIYADKGWDLLADRNARLAQDESVPALAWPTLSDLVGKVEEVIATLGYDRKVADDMRAALLTRLQSLRIGAKGAMLDTHSSVDMQSLLESSTVLELERLGDDDDKAFVMGLILIRMIEHLRALGPSAPLRHLLIVEEAHRLLKQTEATGRSEDASPRAKAVETFSNLLSEVRAYGEGIVIVDQSPSILAPAAIKNTNLKLAHRLVAAQDKACMTAALGMKDEDAEIFGGLQRGFALAMGPRDDHPLILAVLRGELVGEAPADEVVRSQFAEKNALLHRQIVEQEAERYPIALQISEMPQFRVLFDRLVLTLVYPELAPESAIRSLARYVCSRVVSDPARMLSSTLRIAALRFGELRGAAREWSYGVTAEFTTALVAAVAALAAADMASFHELVEKFRELYRSGHVRWSDPYPACAEVCPNEGSGRLCAFRESVSGIRVIPQSLISNPDAVFVECMQLTEPLLAGASGTRGLLHARLALCFAQQRYATEPYYQVVQLVERSLQSLAGRGYDE